MLLLDHVEIAGRIKGVVVVNCVLHEGLKTRHRVKVDVLANTHDFTIRGCHEEVVPLFTGVVSVRGIEIRHEKDLDGRHDDHHDVNQVLPWEAIVLAVLVDRTKQNLVFQRNFAVSKASSCNCLTNIAIFSVCRDSTSTCGVSSASFKERLSSGSRVEHLSVLAVT